MRGKSPACPPLLRFMSLRYITQKGHSRATLTLVRSVSNLEAIELLEQMKKSGIALVNKMLFSAISPLDSS